MRIERQLHGTCKKRQFQCGSDECISGYKLCDGPIDCSDGSDETSKYCAEMSCPSYGFRCAYGACIAGRQKCDGHIDCSDGSDETSILCNHVQISSTTHRAHELSNGFDTPKCPPIIGLTISAQCLERSGGIGISKSCHSPSEPATVAHIICKPGYKRDEPVQIIECHRDGLWSAAPLKCNEICGIPRDTNTTVNSPIDLTRVPWNVMIYKQLQSTSSVYYEQVCGGTIITLKLVVSAMHCFWNTFENERHNISLFRVFAGKIFRNVLAEEPFSTQSFLIEDVLYINNDVDKYRDFQGNYEHDIAIVVLKQPLIYSNHISSVCVYNQLALNSNTVGTVAGWGLLQNEQRSSVLKIDQLPIVSTDQCKAHTEATFHPLITTDKFCAGYLDKITVCGGDSGAGFVTVKNGVHYLCGIVSTGNKAPCSRSFLTTFTKVAYYSDFIQKYYSMYEPLL